MGGDYYDRDVGTSNNSQANEALSQTSIHSSCNPIRWKEEKLECIAKNPLVFALDVTGSMGDWTKIIYDKMPMFYGQMMMQKYIEDPCVSFCAIGDHGGDLAPLQCTEFGRGNEIDQLISKIYLEGNGQGNQKEGYEMSAYFYSHRVELISSEIPFMFITGDEGFYKSVDDHKITGLLGVPPLKKMVEGSDMFKAAMQKYNLFHVKKDYGDGGAIRKQWADAIGEERILDLKTPKACVDIILGAIALTSGSRDLNGYLKDLEERGQSKDRVVEVTHALTPYWNALKKGTIKPLITKSISKLSLEEIKKLAKEERTKAFGDIALERDQILNKLGEQVPKEYLCPITGLIMIAPVITTDGETYEKLAIELYFKHSSCENPFTKEKLEGQLLKNTILNKMIDSFVVENQI
jgi:hypothetical protein